MELLPLCLSLRTLQLSTYPPSHLGPGLRLLLIELLALLGLWPRVNQLEGKVSLQLSPHPTQY